MAVIAKEAYSEFGPLHDEVLDGLSRFFGASEMSKCAAYTACRLDE